MRILLGLTLFAVTGCFGAADLDGLACPCADGWTCCEGQGVCVRDQAECPTDDAGSPPSGALSVSPESARLRLGGSQSFTASVAVTWSVEPPNGGAIDANGDYRAPLRPGVYQVRATSAGGEDEVVEVTVGPQELSVAAGRPGGAGHADGFGSDARFRAPRNLVGDDAFLYVNDTYSIRRIEIETGEVTTLAPDFSAGYLAIGALGLYASTPQWGNQIQRIDPTTGAVTLLAGSALSTNPWTDWHDGTGTGAGFNTILSLAGDGKSLYANDNGLLRRVDTESGAVETLAMSQFWVDNGPVPVNFPDVSVAPWDTMGPIAVRAGHVYAVESSTLDQTAEGIWKYDPVTGSFEPALASTVPLGPTPPLLAAGGTFPSVGFDDEGAPLVVEEHALVRPVILNGKVFTYPAVGNIAEYGDTDGLGAQARLAAPLGIWSAGVGATDQYVADTGNGKIRRIQMTAPSPSPGSKPWIVSTLAGESEHSGTDNGVGTEARLMRPHRLAADDQGAVLVAEVATNGSFYVDQVRRIDPNGATSILTALPTYSFEQPSNASFVLGMAVAQGVLFVTAVSGYGPTSAHDFLRFDAKSGKWISLDCDQPSDRWYSGLAYDGKEYLYVVDAKLGVVERFDVKAALSACSGGEPSVPGTTVATGLTAPASPVATSDAIFKGFRELAVDGDRGLLFVGDNDAIKKVDLDSGEISVLAAPEGGWGPIEGLAYDPAGVLYVLPAGDWMKPIGGEPGGAHQISALVVETGEIYAVAGTLGHEGVKLGALPGGVNNPSAITLLPGGEVAIADEDEHVVLIAK